MQATCMVETKLVCIFPAEIVCHILGYLSPSDVVRWRTVSKWFNAITNDTSIWKDLYANSHLPRPPGPFPFQDSAYLEQALVRTEKLARSWTAIPLRNVSHMELRVDSDEMHPVKFLGGRWVIECELDKRIVLHDVDASGEQSTLQRQVIWEQEQELLDLDAALITTNDGQLVLYVSLSSECQWDTHITVWKVLEFQLDSESCMTSAVTVLDITPPRPEETELCLEGGNSPFLLIGGPDLVFDTRSRVFYKFPEPCIALEKTRCVIDDPDSDFSTLDFCVPTNTHVVAFHRYSRLKTLVQVFINDESSVKDDKGVLRLSHEGTLNKDCFDAILLRNSTIDPVTGATNLRLFIQEFDARGHSVLNLTLPEPSGGDVLPITISVDEKFTSELPGYHFLISSYFDCSDAGHLRGIYIAPHTVDGVYPVSLFAMKFVIDATQDECILICGELLPLKWSHIESKIEVEGMFFDGTRGRFCFHESRVVGSNVFVVVDVE